MRGPFLTITCLDESASDLRARLATAASRAGLPDWVSEAAGSEGTLAVWELPVEVLEVGPVEDSDEWRTLSERIGAVLDEVNPSLAVAGFSARLDLDAPVWQEDGLHFASGRARVDRMDVDQQRAFNELIGAGLVAHVDGVVRWATPPVPPLGVRLLDVDPVRLAAAVFQAWTGEEARSGGPAEDLDEVNLPVLWLGREGGAAALVDDVRAALPKGWTVGVEDDYGRFAPVEARPAGPLPLTELLEVLRRLVAAASPHWAGVLPRGGVLPPGVEPDLPDAAVVDHVWVDRAWAGDDLGHLAAVLSPVAGEAVGPGLLFVTGPDPRRGDGDHVWPPVARYEHLVRAAAVLGGRVAAGGPGQ